KQLITQIEEENVEENLNSTSLRVAERLAKKKSKRSTYLIAALMSSFGITSLAILSVYYRFSWQMEGGDIPVAEMLGTFALSVGAAVGMEFWARWARWSHHKPREGAFELNDVFAIINAVLAIGLINYGFFHKGIFPGLCFGAPWECTTGKEFSWNLLSLFTTSGMLFLEISLLAFLLQGSYASGLDALTRTFVISGIILSVDILLKVSCDNCSQVCISWHMHIDSSRMESKNKYREKFELDKEHPDRNKLHKEQIGVSLSKSSIVPRHESTGSKNSENSRSQSQACTPERLKSTADFGITGEVHIIL
ncbi:hypothetical protein IFM89_021181, partial [Coptis chinensis]